MDYRKLQKEVYCKRCNRRYKTLIDLSKCDYICSREDCFDVYVGKKEINNSKRNNMVT